MTCCAMRSGRRMRGTATTLHRRGRIAGGLDDVSETVTLSLKVPAAMKRALEKEAKAEGKSTGAYARGILADGLMAIA